MAYWLQYVLVHDLDSVCSLHAFFEFFIFMTSVLQKGSGGGLSDVAPWKGHLAWRALPDFGPCSGATGTWQSWQAMYWQFDKYGKIPVWFE